MEKFVNLPTLQSLSPPIVNNLVRKIDCHKISKLIPQTCKTFNRETTQIHNISNKFTTEETPTHTPRYINGVSAIIKC